MANETFDLRPPPGMVLRDPDPGGVTLEIERHEGRQVVTRHVQDVEPILEDNRARATSGDGYSASREIREIGSIPMVLALELAAQGKIDLFGDTDFKLVRKLMNDPDYRHLRSSPGRA